MTPDTTTETAALRKLADDIFAAATEPVLDVQDLALHFDPSLWSTLTESGLTLLATPEEHGGSGAGPAEVAVVLESAGYHAAPVPLAEHDLLASWLARSAGLPAADQPMTASTTSESMQGQRLVAVLENVPWASASHRIMVAGDGFVASLGPEHITIEESKDIAGQPSGRVHVDAELTEDNLRSTGVVLHAELRLRGAYVRALQICGALERALTMSCEHALNREQFGRPLSKFQAVQTLISDAACALALAKSATAFATEMVTSHGFDSDQAGFAIAVAKIESAWAATIVARNAHQVHGAIGFTLDHRLRHFTTRALAWRSEFGSQRQWEHRLGQLAIETDSTIWELVTALRTTASSEALVPSHHQPS